MAHAGSSNLARYRNSLVLASYHLSTGSCANCTGAQILRFLGTAMCRSRSPLSDHYRDHVSGRSMIERYSKIFISLCTSRAHRRKGGDLSLINNLRRRKSRPTRVIYISWDKLKSGRS